MISLNNPVKPDLKKLNIFLEMINKNGWYTNFGPLHNELTERLEDYLGVKNLLLTNNGTTALQVAAKAIGSTSILSTPFSFVATVSAFKWQKYDVSFSDIDTKSLNLSPDGVRTAYRKGCKADTLVATHVYGNPCEVEALQQLSDTNNFQVIYDAAHAFGVNLENQSVLNFGDASTLSFHATKIFHTIEGGGVVFNDRTNYEKAIDIINFGINPEQGVVDVGINAKLNEYQAAVGLVNLENISNIIDHRANLFYQYRKKLFDVVEMPVWHKGTSANGAYMPILLKNKDEMKDIANELLQNGIQSRHYFSPSLEKIFVDSHNYGTPTSYDISQRILCLPMHAYLTLEDVEKVTSIIIKKLK